MAARDISKQKQPRPKQKRTLGFMPLEPRMLYDGAAAATVAHHHQHHQDAHDTGHDASANTSTNGAVANFQNVTGAAAAGPADGSHENHKDNHKTVNSQAATQSAPQVATPVQNPTEIVFVDSKVADAQELISGAKPGVEVVVLNANSNGLDQIADFLKHHPDPNLTTIDIVANGDSSTLYLGNAVITNGNLSQYAKDLGEIGNSLQPGGDIALYACNVAQGASGTQFIGTFSQLAKNVDVAASTHLVGSDGSDGTWILDAATGALVPSSANPFTAKTLADYQGNLLTPNGDLVVAGQTSDASNTGTFDTYSISNTGQISQTPSSTATTALNQMVIDPGTGDYIAVSLDNAGKEEIVLGSLANPASETVLFNAPNNTIITALTVDSAHQTIYFAEDSVASKEAANTATLEALTFAGPNYTGKATLTQLQTFAPNTPNTPGGAEITGLALNTTGTQLFMSFKDTSTANTGGYSDVVPTVHANGIYSASIAFNAGQPTLTTTLSETAGKLVEVPASPNDGQGNGNDGTVAGITYYNGDLFFITNPLLISATTNGQTTTDTFSSEGVYEYNSTTTGGSISTLHTDTSFSTTTNEAELRSIVIDPTSGRWYADNSAAIGTPGSSSIWYGSLNGQTFNSFTTSQSQPGGLAIDYAPALTTSAHAVTDQSGGSAVTIDSGIAITDTTNSVLASASVSITSNYQSTDTLSATTTGTNITASYSNGTLTLSGADTIAHYEQVLDTVAFSTSSASSVQRIITYAVSDGLLSSNTGTDAVNVKVGPTVTAGASVTYTAGGSAVVLDSGLTVTDSAPITQATVEINNGSPVSGDTLGFNSSAAFTLAFSGQKYTLSFADGAQITSGSTAGTDGQLGQLVLSSPADKATAADWQAALDAITFSSTNADPTSGGTQTTRTIDWKVSDSITAITAFSSAKVQLPPVQITAGASVTFDGGGSPVVLDSGLTISDSASTTLTGATVSIGAGVASGDTLTINGTTSGTINDGANGSISYVLSGGTLTLTGTDTIADYQAALREVTYSFSPSNGDPTAGGGDTSRTISWTATDGTNTSAAVTSSLTVVHEPPTVTAGATASYIIEVGTPVTLDSSISVSDSDSSGQLTGATVAIGTGFQTGDVLKFTNTASISGSYNAATGALTLSGADTIANYQAALASVSFSTTSTVAGDRTIDWTVNDGNANAGASTQVTSTLHVHTGPQLGGGGVTQTFTGGSAPITLDSGITVSDDASGTLTGATVSISTGFISGDALSFTAVGNVTGSYNAATGVLTLSGTDTLAHYQAVLDSVAYTSGNGDPTGGGTHTARTITWTVTDPNAASASTTSALTTIHVAPTVTAGASATFDGGGSPVALDPTLTVQDVDSGGNLVSAQVTMVGSQSGDTLTINGTTSGTLDHGASGKITYSYSNGVLTLSGTDTVADYQAALRAVSYGFNPTNGDPTNGGTTTTRSFYWGVNDGNTLNGTNGSFHPSATAINNDQPSLGLNQLVVLYGTFPAPADSTAGDPGGIPIGFIRTFAGNFAWNGTALADGQLLSIQQNAALFALLGTFYGGNGTNNFELPNFEGRLGIGVDSSTPLGTQTGTDSFQITTTNLPPPTGIDAAIDNQQPSLAINYLINTGGTQGGVDVAGEVVPFAGNFAPAGYLLAQGQTLQISQYQALYNAIGATYGGDGVTTFKLPDLRNTDIIGAGTDGTQSVSEGTTTGSNSVTLTSANLPAGGDQPVNNYQNSVALNYIVATEGLFPSQGGGGTSATSAYIGEVIAYAGKTIPTGWALANGQTLAIQSNEALFSVLGTTYGGNGQSTFQLPDLVGRSVAGVGTDSFGKSVQLGQDYGAPSFTVTGSNLPNATSTLTIVHEPPSVTAGGTATYAVGSSAVAVDSTATVADPDSGGVLTGATVKIGSGFVSGDSLNFTNQNNITGSYNAATGVLTLSGSDTLADYQAAIDSITFSTTATTQGTRTLDWTVTDGNTSNGTSTVATSTVNVSVGPQITAGASVTFDGGGAPVVLDSNLTVTDPGSATLTGATVNIDKGVASGDTLTINGTTVGTIDDGANGSITYIQSGASLILTGTDTVADYQAALRLVTYSFTPSNGDPTAGGGDTARSISWTANDGTNSNAVPATSSLTVVHEPPTVTAGGTVNYEIGQTASVVADATASASDVDSSGLLTGATVSVITGYQSGDTLNFTNQNGISGTFNPASGILSLTGTATVADYVAALDSITFNTTSTIAGDRTIGWKVSDSAGSSSNVPSSTVHVVAGPQVVAGASVTFDGGSTTAVRLDSGLTISDAGSGTLETATITITNGYQTGDSLGFTNIPAVMGNIDVSSKGGGQLVLTSAGGTATLAQWQAALDSVTYLFIPTSGDPTNGGGDTSRTISWSVSDAKVTSPTVTSTLNVVHEPPIVTAGANTTYETGQSALGTLNAPTITAPDSSGELSSVTIAIANPQTGDSLGYNSTTTPDGVIVASGSATSITLTLQGGGQATVADFEAALAHVSFNTTGSTAGIRTIDWSANDGSSSNGTSNVATNTVTVVSGPSISTGNPSITFDGGSTTPVVLDPTLTITDPSSATLVSATVSVGTGFVSGDTLSITGGNFFNIHGAFSGETLVLSGIDTVAHYQAVLREVAFSFNPSNGDPTAGGTSRAISWQVSDGVGAASAATSLTVVHEPPTVTAGASVNYVVGDPAATLDSGLTVSDPDSGGNLTSATVQIGAGFVAGADTLGFTNQNNITGSYNATTGILTLIGTDTLAHYQAALDSITFTSTASAPGSRTIDWTVSDTASSSVTTTSSVNVETRPVVVAGATATFTGGGGPVTLDTTLSVTDAAYPTLESATISITGGFATGDTLSFINTSSFTYGNIQVESYDSATGVLTLISVGATSSVAQWQHALDAVTYSFSGNGDPGVGGSHTTRTVTWTVNDGNLSSNPVTSTVDIVHTAPTVTAGGTANFAGGDTTPLTLDPTVTVSDPDSSGNLTGATVSIASPAITGDTLTINGLTSGTINNGANGSISYSFSSATDTLILTGNDTVADYQAALREVAYSVTPANADPTGGSPDAIVRNISWQVTDGSPNNGSSNFATSLLSTSHTPPTITLSGVIPTYDGGGAAVALDSGVTVGDVDSGGILTGATVEITNGFATGDILNFTDQNNITGSYDAVSGTLTLTGTDTLAHYQAALESITYSFVNGTAGDPTRGGRDTARQIAWTVYDDVNGPVGTSLTPTSSLAIVHEPPVVTAGATVTFVGGGSAVTLDPTLTLTNIDSTEPRFGDVLVGAKVTISSGALANDVLSFNNGTNTETFADGDTITATYANGVLTLKGNASFADYQTALRQVQFGFNGNGDPTADGDTQRTISWQVEDAVAATRVKEGEGEGGGGLNPAGVSAIVTSTLDVVHTPPTVTPSGVTETYTAGGTGVVIDPGLALSDVDSGGTLTGATVSISAGFLTGDTLNFANQNGISGSYDAATGILTLSGTASVAAYQAALESINFSSSNADPTGGGHDATRTISWTVNDGATSHATATATTTLAVQTPTTTTLAPPPEHGPPTFTNAVFNGDTTPGGSSRMVTDIVGNGFAAFTSPGTTITTAHGDISVTMTADGGIDFQLPIGSIEAALGGDIVGMRLTTPSGQPLPPWLNFNVADAKFAGQVPDQIATGSLGPDGGFGTPANGAGPGDQGKPHDDVTGAAVLPTITIKVVATDAKGDTVIYYLNVKLNAAPPATNGDKHGELHQPFAPHQRMGDLDPSSLPIQRALALAAWGRPSAEHNGAADGLEAAQAGRAGLSTQLDGLGWRAMNTQRTALLASFQRLAAGGR